METHSFLAKTILLLLVLPDGALGSIFQNDSQFSELGADFVGHLVLLGLAQVVAGLDQEVDKRGSFHRLSS